MPTIESRRYFLAALAGGAAGIIGAPLVMTGRSFAEEPPPETATIRFRHLLKGRGLCNAPQSLAEDLLREEGFTDVRSVSVDGRLDPLVHGEIDLIMSYAPGTITAIDSGTPITMLAGVHVGCNVTFAHWRLRKASQVSRL
jgi:NitT/TauT family transport system substrate-binding protein